MQSQERDLIAGLFGRLQSFENQPRDAEADALIRDLVQRQPGAPYLLTQTVLVQEQALKAAQERIAELEAKAAAVQTPAAGFLDSAPRIGPWGAPAAPAAARTSVPTSGSVPATGAAPAPSPLIPSPTRSPLQAAVSQPAAGGGFLRSAMATAAGVAGGALLFEGIRNLMGGGSPAGTAQAAASQTPPELMPPSAGQQQAFSAPEPDDGAADDGRYEPQQEYDTASYDDAGGGGDDWA